MSTEVTVPTLGESITEATVGQWLKQPGDAVGLDEPIASLETDKVAIEVPSPVAGTMGEHIAAEGDTVEVGALLARIEAGEGAPKAKSAPPPAEMEPARTSAAASPPAPAHDDSAMPPSVRRAVAETGVDPASVHGTGRDGRLTKEDVVKAAFSPAPAPAAPKVSDDRREERVKMSRLRQTVARRLKEAQNSAALLTTFNDVDMSAVIATREKYKDLFAKKHDVKLGFMSFFARASCLALTDIPAVNGRIDGDEIVYHDYVDISVAVSAPNGLVVPVVRSADAMSFAEIELAIADLGKRAKAGTLAMADMAGGTFTISNGGIFGGLLSTPIINPPQSAVLGLHRIEDRAVVIDGQIVVRPMMYMALSYDHRLIDGREAVTALKRIKEAIEDPMRLLIDL